MHELLGERERRLARRQELDVVWELDGELVLGHGHDAAGVAVDDRDRRAPVALARDQPVAQAVLHRGSAPAVGVEVRGDRGLRLFRWRPVELPGVHEHARLEVGLRERRAVPVLGRDHHGDRQPEQLGELEVTVVVRGHAHDRARAVRGECVVGDPDRDAVAREVVDAVRAGEDARLLALGRLPLQLRGVGCGLHVRLDLLALLVGGEFGDEPVLGGEHHERHAVQGVRARGEDADLIRAVGGGRLEGEGRLGALGAADPVALHELDVLRPRHVGVVEELVGVVGDAEEPLLHRALLDEVARALACAVEDLLVGEHGVAGRAPVDGGAVAVGQALLEELEEPPLRPAVVLGRARVDLALPVEHRAHALELAAHALDVAVGPVLGVRTARDRGVLGGQAEGVEAHGEQHVGAVHAAEARDGVRGRHREPVPDVQVARCVGQHREVVPVVPTLHVIRGAVQAGLGPALLPARLDGDRVVAVVRRLSVAGRLGCCLFLGRHGCYPVPVTRRPAPAIRAYSIVRTLAWPSTAPIGTWNNVRRRRRHTLTLSVQQAYSRAGDHPEYEERARGPVPVRPRRIEARHIAPLRRSVSIPARSSWSPGPGPGPS